MGKFSNLLIVSDLDGTYLDSDSVPVAANDEAVAYFIQNGGRFTIATGRTTESIQHVLEHSNICINAPAITYNGSMIYDFSDGHTIYEFFLDARAMPIVKAVMKEFPSVGVEIFNDNKMYIARENDYTKNHVRIEHLTFRPSTVDEIPLPWCKVLFCESTELLEVVREFVFQLNNPLFRAGFSAKHYLEIVPKTSSKGKALKYLCNLLGVPLRNSYAIGDYYNDIELIQTAGLGATVEDAPQEVKDAAGIVLGSNNDGAIAQFIAYIEQNERLGGNHFG